MIFFKNNEKWKNYLNELNEYCGNYKYRWWVIETIALFAYTYFENPIYDFKLKEKNLYNNKFEAIFSSTVPSVNPYFNINKLPFLKYFHYIKSKFIK